MFPKRAFLFAAPVVLLAALTGPSRAGTLSASASCGDGNIISFHWDYLEWTGNLTGHPEWVGYDVWRRTLDPCSAPVRVNSEPFPRVVGESHGHTYVETAPVSKRTYEYRVILVDAARNEVFLSANECECQAGVGWASCPDLSAPLTHGTLEDWGWALYVKPCESSCYRGFYFGGPIADELRPYAGTYQGFRFYGTAQCGTVEGCGMTVDRYETVWCDAINPVTHTTWGRLKIIYR